MDPRGQRYVGVGDIIASYRADRIALGKPSAKPFEWQGAPWLATALDQSGASTYRLTYDGREWLLRGPPARFTAKDEQLRLFDD